MISQMFNTITQAISSFIGSLGQAVTSVADLFYHTSETGGEFTLLGTLMLIGVGVGLVYWAFRLIRGLVSRSR